MRARKTAIFAAIGCVAALGLTAPAAAADAAPTISAPASRVGYGSITITGTAPAGATVELFESAYVYNDFYASPDYANGGVITTKASTSGHYTLNRLLDSGFRFYVRANGVESKRISVAMGIIPTMTMSASNGSVDVKVAADPGQPGLAVHIQRSDSGTWTTVNTGHTGSAPDGVYTTTLSGQGSGTRIYRAVIDADKDNNLLTGQTTSISLNVGSGSGGGTGGGGTKPPATPPTAPAAPKAGDVVFSKIVYNSPGKDTGSNTSLNAEYVRLLNKSRTTINLKGWTVRDAAGHVYTVRTDQRISAGKYVYLHTGKGTNGRPDSRHRYWNSTGYVWSNGGDTAYLRTGAGKAIDSCKWTSDKGKTYC
ncbi:lamin tail domain-containing protein [Actinoplanes friuliensis]|uniref:LTD domain-containing protein n=1 Tax=Actinoplanes friuliensis DSM 7358 TaxID=1246995 RepID=U5WD14_9ACTN|nr:lamin tail domain-containing protein [Actinoplanes friuliensis]AGZ45910.1 hypothetical protein AFR_38280 [Actinoplanes friuliensis DSM 7358]